MSVRLRALLLGLSLVLAGLTILAALVFLNNLVAAFDTLTLQQQSWVSKILLVFPGLLAALVGFFVHRRRRGVVVD